MKKIYNKTNKETEKKRKQETL